MKAGKILLIALPLIIVIIIFASILVLAAVPKIPASCTSVITSGFKYTQSGYNYVCGSGSASDGRLDIVMHNYYFAQGRDIPFQPPGSEDPAEVFLLVNVSISNVGGGNTSVGGSFYAHATDNSGNSVGNGELLANVTFANEYPNQSMPSNNGVLYLAPGAKLDLWLVFYIPSSGPVSNQTTINVSNFQLST